MKTSEPELQQREEDHDNGLRRFLSVKYGTSIIRIAQKSTCKLLAGRPRHSPGGQDDLEIEYAKQ